jgi:hypothetical protein
LGQNPFPLKIVRKIEGFNMSEEKIYTTKNGFEVFQTYDSKGKLTNKLYFRKGATEKEALLTSRYKTVQQIQYFSDGFSQCLDSCLGETEV